MSFVLGSTVGSVMTSHGHEVGGVPFPWTGTFLVLAFPTFFGGGEGISNVLLKIFRGENILHDFV